MVILLFLIVLLVYLLPTYPKPVVIENFLSENERIHIKQEAKSKLHVSTVDKDRRVDENDLNLDYSGFGILKPYSYSEIRDK